MLTFTRDDNNTYVVTANDKFVGRLVKIIGVWCLKFNDVSSVVVHIPFETSLELTESEIDNDFNTWLTLKDVEYFGELSRNKYKE